MGQVNIALITYFLNFCNNSTFVDEHFYKVNLAHMSGNIQVLFPSPFIPPVTHLYKVFNVSSL